ncbi:MAG: hypothetical protein WA751_02380 [Candidatus Dormiibacterota bacterium]
MSTERKPSLSSPVPGSGSPPLGRTLRRWRWLAVAVVVITLVAVGAAILVSRPAGAAQQRSDFTTMVRTLRADLAGCNSRAATAISTWRLTEQQPDSAIPAERAARATVRACSPGTDDAIFDLTLYAVPTSLSALHLGYAVSCLGVWAEEDVVPAMRNEEELLRRPGDQSAATAYLRQAGWAAQNLASANSTLRRAGGRLGVTGFSPIRLTALDSDGLPLLPR